MTSMYRRAILTAVFASSLTLAATALPVCAQTFGGTLSTGLKAAAPKELQGAGDLPTIVGRIISSVIGFLGVILLGYLLYGGFIWMTAGGDTKKVQEATATIRNAVVGLIIIAASYAIASQVIISLGTVTGTGQAQGQPGQPPG